MNQWKDCPWYAWVFPFFSGLVLTAVAMLWFIGSCLKRTFRFELWLGFIGEFFLDWLVLFMLPLLLLTFAVGVLLPQAWI